MSVTTRLQAMQPTDIGVPGPTSLDMARGFLSIRADPLAFLGEVSQRYGDTVSFPVPGAPALLLNDPADVRHVLQTSARSWSKDTIQYAALARVTGPGLLASAEPNWIEHRRLAAPAFHHQRLEAVGDEVRAAARSAISARLGGCHAAAIADGAVVDVAELTHTIGLDAVGRALFSTDLSEHAQDLLTATSDSADLVVRLGRSILPRAEWTPTRTNLRLRSARRRLDAATAAIIAERRARNARAGGPGRTTHHGDDLLGLLLDSGMTDGEIRDELVTMVIAGHETVAAALAWTLMLLAENPQAQDRVRAELEAHPGPVPLVGHRESLPWTRAVVDEALRLFPPAWAISRRAHRDDELAGRHVPAGTLAIISPWLVHRRPDIWPEPEAFRPERFLDGTARTGYLPFGQGPRLCIGREFALGEMVLVLAELLREHRIDVPGGPDGWTRPAAETKVAVHPRGGMPLLVRRTGTP
ncbi:cytochrome P450 [Nocardioides luteus]|uniref:Cytochrome P450 n=1 Tax=Nocardioides luteus TaxID=1844 RepID=A0ABQ5ST88_9ACTN|nr:cytochrome P450 [Nocardioides luteus]MDR7311380.1 cytochrome P450 [Nocardioides luteus]GGR65507.1 cytochrome P450 [Nocardioides luteus]GLJ66885.1 cytochrome P450 [Nocardioides luteus]